MTSPPLIALVGSDGAGKSTVGEALLAWLREDRPAELCHLGKQTGNIARAIARWPVIGRPFDRRLDRVTAKAGAPKGPGSLAALAMYLFSMRRVRRFRRMRRLRAAGFTILTDRFPQTELPGVLDGPGLAGRPQRTALGRLLADREARLYADMVGDRPDMVIRLTVGLATAAARKPDHKPAALAEKIATLSSLRYGGATIVDIDTTQPLDRVIAEAKAAMADVLGRTDA